MVMLLACLAMTLQEITISQNIPLHLTYSWVGIGIVQITYQDTEDIADLQLHP